MWNAVKNAEDHANMWHVSHAHRATRSRAPCGLADANKRQKTQTCAQCFPKFWTVFDACDGSVKMLLGSSRGISAPPHDGAHDREGVPHTPSHTPYTMKASQHMPPLCTHDAPQEAPREGMVCCWCVLFDVFWASWLTTSLQTFWALRCASYLSSGPSAPAAWACASILWRAQLSIFAATWSKEPHWHGPNASRWYKLFAIYWQREEQTPDNIYFPETPPSTVKHVLRFGGMSRPQPSRKAKKLAMHEWWMHNLHEPSFSSRWHADP